MKAALNREVFEFEKVRLSCDPANDNAQRLILVARHEVPQLDSFFPHARAGVLFDDELWLSGACAPSTRQGEAQLAQAQLRDVCEIVERDCCAEQAGGWGLTKYDARMDVWLSPDPILAQYMRGRPVVGAYDPANLGLYTFAWNNPVNVEDPDGRCVPTDAEQTDRSEPRPPVHGGTQPFRKSGASKCR